MKIQVIRDWDRAVKAEAEGIGEVILAWDGEYRKGDFIVFSGLTPHSYYQIKADAAIETSFVYVTQEELVYTIPFYEKKESMNPLAFAGNRHYLSIRPARKDEILQYRNLALNPFDQHDAEGIYPHASANVETRGESVFAARNAIDGVLAVNGHGEWPYESWGINRRDDAQLLLEFGRPVNIDRIALYTRADFPHDNWWIRAVFEFSDGSEETVSMEKKTAGAHEFSIQKNGITWLRLGRLMKADDPSPFPALTQIQVFGTNTPLS